MEIPIILTASAYQSMAYFDDEKGKIFVGGLSWDTTHTSLLEYFGKFGEVIDCVVMKNQITGKSRGFGFVKFKDSGVVDDVMSSGPHYIDGRQVDPKICNPRSQNFGGKSAENSRKKIFVGGLPPSCDEAQLREVFRRYGQVDEATIMYDQEKNKSRGFGFLTFTDEESVDRVCNDHYICINGKQVEVKRAEPRVIKSIADTANRLWSSALCFSNSGFPYALAAPMAPNATDFKMTNGPSLPATCPTPGVQDDPIAVTAPNASQQPQVTTPVQAAATPMPTILCAPPLFPGQACPIPLSQYTAPLNGVYYLPATVGGGVQTAAAPSLAQGMMAFPMQPRTLTMAKVATGQMNGTDEQPPSPPPPAFMGYSGMALSDALTGMSLTNLSNPNGFQYAASHYISCIRSPRHSAVGFHPYGHNR